MFSKMVNKCDYVRDIFNLFNVVLGSSSSSRKAILKQLLGNTPFISCSPDINESEFLTDNPETSAIKIAQAKADFCLDALKNGKAIKKYIENREESNNSQSDGKLQNDMNQSQNELKLEDYLITNSFFLICSDQIAYYNSQIRQKPRTKQEAEKNINEYSSLNSPIETISAVVLVNSQNNNRIEKIETAKVWFKNIPDEKIKAIVEEGKIFHSAGGFLIDDDTMGPYVEKIEGNSDAILGLPISLLISMFDELASYEGGWESSTLDTLKKGSQDNSNIT